MDEIKGLHNPPISLDPLIHQRLPRSSNNPTHPTPYINHRSAKFINPDGNKMLQRPSTKEHIYKKRLTFRLLIIR